MSAAQAKQARQAQILWNYKIMHLLFLVYLDVGNHVWVPKAALLKQFVHGDEKNVQLIRLIFKFGGWKILNKF